MVNISATIPVSETINQSIALVLSADQKVPLTAEQITSTRRINEQEGYAVLVHQYLKSKHPSLAPRFERDLKAATDQYRQNHSDTNLFKVADRLMRQYLREKQITQDQYRSVRDFAFGKAQLDSDRTSLGVQRTPEAKEGDTPVRALSTFYKKIETNAVALPEEIAQFRAAEAQLSVAKWRERQKLNSRETTSGSPEKTARSLTLAPQQSEGFLWKPQSDSDGKLVVLLPASMSASRVSSVVVKDANSGEILESGRFSGIANGSRLHFRFSKSGEKFPDGSLVEIRFTDGSTSRIRITDTGERIEGAA